MHGVVCIINICRKYLKGTGLEEMIALIKMKTKDELMQEEKEEKDKEERKLAQMQKEKEREKKKEDEEEEERKHIEEEKQEKERTRLEQERLEEEQKLTEKKKVEDEKVFAAKCKKGNKDVVAKSLEINPGLLNCLQGEPLRQAVLGRNMAVIETLMANMELDINLPDHNDLTALHIGTSTDIPEIVKKLLSHPDIKVNPEGKKGLTPVMTATRNGKINSLQVLLEDSRVDLEIVDEEGKSIEDMLGDALKFPLPKKKVESALALFREARRKLSVEEGSLIRKKSVIIVINHDYSKTKMGSLEGPLHDSQSAEKLFRSKGYSIYHILNSDDILEDVIGVIEENQLKETDVFQFVYSGHGIHKLRAEKGPKETWNAKVANYRQADELGDCLVNTDGTLCEELLLSWQIAKELKTDASMCFLYDCCRTEFKDGTQQFEKEFIKTNTFEYLQGVQKIGADRRMVKIFSAQLGETAAGFGSYFQRICQEIEDSYPRGMKLSDMEKFESKNQKCQVVAGGMGWDEKLWPLE